MNGGRPSGAVLVKARFLRVTVKILKVLYYGTLRSGKTETILQDIFR